MMFFEPEVGLSIKGGECVRKAGRGKGNNKCNSETKKNQSWGMLPRDQRKVTSPQRLKWPIK
jgi:hypothetical protein